MVVGREEQVAPLLPEDSEAVAALQVHSRPPSSPIARALLAKPCVMTFAMGGGCVSSGGGKLHV